MPQGDVADGHVNLKVITASCVIVSNYVTAIRQKVRAVRTNRSAKPETDCARYYSVVACMIGLRLYLIELSPCIAKITETL